MKKVRYELQWYSNIGKKWVFCSGHSMAKEAFNAEISHKKCYSNNTRVVRITETATILHPKPKRKK